MARAGEDRSRTPSPNRRPAAAPEPTDWSQTCLGPQSEWPQSLKTAVATVLACRFPLILLWGSDGTLVCNDAYASVMGATRDTLSGASVLEAWPDLADYHRNVLEVVLGGGTLSYRDRQFTVVRNGATETAWLSMEYSPVPGDDGRPAGVLAIVSDTTKRVLAEEALSESDAKFRVLANNMSQLAWMADQTGAIFWYNKRWFDFTGTTLEEMRGWGWRTAHHPDHVDRVVEKISHCFKTGEDWEDTFPLMGRDGTYRWFLSRALPIRDDNGNVVRWLGTNTDITEHRAEAERNAQLAAIVSTSPDAMLSLSSGGIILSWNPGAQRLLGYEAREVIGKSERILFAEDADKEFEEKYAHLRQGESVLRDTLRRRKDGSLVEVAINAAPMRSPEGRIFGFSAVMRDITDRKRAENHLRVVLRELSHRTKNLLAVIIAMVRQTARGSTDVGALQSHLVQRLQGMSASHDLLVAEDWAGASLRDLIRVILTPFVGEAAGPVNFEGPDVFVSTTAAQNLGLALHELATNAAKYGALSTPTGKIYIRWVLGTGPDAERRLTVSWMEEGGPRVEPPRRKGFGHVVIESVIARALDATVDYRFGEKGVAWSVSMPPDCVVWSRTQA